MVLVTRLWMILHGLRYNCTNFHTFVKKVNDSFKFWLLASSLIYIFMYICAYIITIINIIINIITIIIIIIVILISIILPQVTVHRPICRKNGNLELALYGSFLPVPSLDVFEKKVTYLHFFILLPSHIALVGLFYGDTLMLKYKQWLFIDTSD